MVGSIDPATRVGPLSLSVADLTRSMQYYTEAIGFESLQRDASNAVLGVGGTPLLSLTEQPGATPWPRGGDSYTGLYHFAILVPTRADLGRWLRHWFELGFPVPGQGDHGVSEALYLEDPDGHGIEIYRDRPRSEWHRSDGQIRMGTGPVDIQGLLGDAERSGEPWTGMPTDTRVGHIHLQVGDIVQAEAFYHGTLGFDVMASMPTALFMSAGGYHHHLGMNTWHSAGAEPAPEQSVRLRYFTIELPSKEAQEAVVSRIEDADLSHGRIGDVVTVQDPWQSQILLQVGSASDLQTVAELEDTAKTVAPAGD